jgi:hypothetical protein
MQSCKFVIADSTTVVLSTDGDLVKFLRGMKPDGDIGSARRSGDTR